MRDGLIVLDAQNRIVDVNPTARRFIGSAAPLTGQPVEEALAAWPDLVARYRDAPDAQAEIRLDGKDAPHYLDIRISPLYDRKGRLSGRSVVARDITEQRRAEEQVRQQQHELSAMEERERIGRELHDGLGQMMGYVNVQAQAALALLAQGRTVETNAT
ncbi:MAG: PAS domain-containing protein, partial [bacterium]|nr:PAS domain-containing protein [bacterium]